MVSPLLQSGSVHEAQAVADGLLDQAAAPARRAHVQAARAMASMWAGRVADAEQAAREALALADPDDADVGVTATSMLAAALGLRGEAAAAVALMQPWVGRVEQVRSLQVQVNFFGNLCNVLMQADRSAQALPMAQRHLALARLGALPGEQVTALMNLTNLHGRRGELEPAIASARQADRLMLESGQAAALGHWNRVGLGYWLCGAGCYAEGLGLLEAALQAFAGTAGNPALLSLTQDLLARVWLTLGQVARAYALVRAEPDAPPGRLRARQRTIRAHVRRAMGQDGDALLQAVLQETQPGEPVRLAVQTDLAAALPAAEALVSLAGVQRLAEEHEYLALAARAAALRVPLLVQLGRHDELAVLLPAAEHAALAFRGPHVYLPELLLCCAEGWQALRRPAAAQRCVDAALHWVYTTALPHVPPQYAEAFLHRNEVNQRLRAAAARRPAAGDQPSSTTTGA